MELKTPLYDSHVALNGKIVPFAGYLLPVQYKTGVIAEHMAVRTAAGLFDVSHMGEIFYEGKDALKNLNFVMTNDFTNMVDGQIRYSPMCNENGGILDDMIIYKFNDEKYMVVVNACNQLNDFEWMKKKAFGDVKITNLSDDYAQIALQGPNAKKILTKMVSENKLPEKYYYFTESVDIGGVPCIVSQTGYTGESGYEIYIPKERAQYVWDLMLAEGKDLGLIPCGLGARDTLRFEASMPLYGHEMDETISPLEAGLIFAVKLNKENFVGKEALEAAKEVKRKRVGLVVTTRGIIRENEDVLVNGIIVGKTTSGTHCPYLGGAYAMALVDINYANEGTKVEAVVRGRTIEAKICKMPFYKIEK